MRVVGATYRQARGPVVCIRIVTRSRWHRYPKLVLYRVEQVTFDLSCICAQLKLFGYFSERCLSQSVGQLPIVQQLLDRVGKRLSIAWRNEQSGFTIDYQFRNACRRRRNNRYTCRHRFHQRDRDTFSVTGPRHDARKDEEISTGQILLDALRCLRPGKLDNAVQAMTRHKCLQSVPFWPSTDNRTVQRNATLVQNAARLNKVLLPLLLFEACDTNNLSTSQSGFRQAIRQRNAASDDMHRSYVTCQRSKQFLIVLGRSLR